MNKREITIIGGQRRYEIIDFAKGFSILTIVVMHLMQTYMTQLPNIIKIAVSLGGTGVHIFFFCSGFGLYLSHIRKPLTYGQFMKRRFVKIYAPYIVIVLISFLIPMMYHGKHRILALLSHVFLFKMFVPQFESSFGGQLWFVSTIIQFYLVFNVLCIIKNKVGGKLFGIICMMVSVVWWIFTAFTGLYNERIWNSFFLQYLWEFALGMILAEFLYNNNDLHVRKDVLYIVMVVGTGLQAFFALNGGMLKSFNDIFAFMGYGAIILIMYNWRIGIINKCVLCVSDFSYELYLVHILIFTVIFKACPQELLLQVAVGVISFMICIIVAIAYHHIIKRLNKRLD